MVDLLEAQLTQALQAGNFEGADRLSAEYSQVMSAALRAAKAADRRAIYERALATLNESLHLTRVLRAHIAVRLRNNSGTLLYQQPDSEHHSWHLEA
jgi:hypothetical protein